MGACCSSEPPVTAAEKKKQVEDQLRSNTLRKNVVQQSADENPLDKYEVVKRLGVGSMGCVDLVQQRPRKKSVDARTNVTSHATGQQEGRLYALKTLRVGRVTQVYLRELKNEIRIVSDLDHPGIVKFYQVYYASTNNQIHIVMEFCSGGDLYAREPYTEPQAAAIVRQILSAVAYMHSRGYVHRDIKFENIMFESKESDKIKVIDFGLSGRYNPNRPLFAQYGTIATMAPEVIDDKVGYDAKCDIWSVGVVAFELICGEKPFQSTSVFILQDKIAEGDYSFSGGEWRGKSAPAKTFCQKLLQLNPKKRPSAEHAMRNKWIEKQVSVAHQATADEEEFANTLSQRRKLMAHSKTPEMQKIAFLLVAHKSFSKEVKELRRLFEHLDTDNTGNISLVEFKEAFQKYSGDEKEMNAIFEGMDIFKDGTISYTEFMATTLAIRGNITEDHAIDAFEQLDVDHSGKITVDNLRIVLGRDFSQEEAERIIGEIDIARDGVVSKEEFIAAFRKNADTVAKSAFVEGMT